MSDTEQAGYTADEIMDVVAPCGGGAGEGRRAGNAHADAVDRLVCVNSALVAAAKWAGEC